MEPECASVLNSSWLSCTTPLQGGTSIYRKVYITDSFMGENLDVAQDLSHAFSMDNCKWQLCTRHVCSQKHTSVCPEQQLVGQPLTRGCESQLTFFLQRTCVCSEQQYVCQSNWTFRISLDFIIRLILQHTRVCSHQQLVGQPSVDLFCNTCVCVYAHSTQQQMVGQPLALGCNP